MAVANANPWWAYWLLAHARLSSDPAFAAGADHSGGAMPAAPDLMGWLLQQPHVLCLRHKSIFFRTHLQKVGPDYLPSKIIWPKRKNIDL